MLRMVGDPMVKASIPKSDSFNDFNFIAINVQVFKKNFPCGENTLILCNFQFFKNGI